MQRLNAMRNDQKIKKTTKILYYITVTVSMLVGLWHFFVPWMFQWYDYLPMQYENLIVGIDYTNYCFSLLLFGLSLMLILLGKKVLGYILLRFSDGCVGISSCSGDLNRAVAA